MNKKNAILLFGGKSFEHDISILTALIVYRNARHTKYNLLPVYVDRNNEWFFYAGDNLKNEMFNDFNKNYKENKFKKIYFKLGVNAFFYKEYLREKKIDVDVCLNCCHGGEGENGAFVNFLSLHGIACSIQMPTALGICMNKVFTKRMASSLKIPVVKYVSISKNDYIMHKDDYVKKINELKFPIIIKPANLGSSIGIEVVHTFEDLDEKLSLAFEFDNMIIVEKAIVDNMQEFNIACAKINDDVIISQIDKPIKTDEILSFKDKYIGSRSDTQNSSVKTEMWQSSPSKSQKAGQYLSKKDFNVEMDQNIKEKIEKYSKSIYKNLDMTGIVRIDYICEKNRVYLNEINSVPGSLGYYFFVPHLFKTLSQFIDALLDQCIKDYNVENNINKNFITNLF